MKTRGKAKIPKDVRSRSLRERWAEAVLHLGIKPPTYQSQSHTRTLSSYPVFNKTLQSGDLVAETKTLGRRPGVSGLSQAENTQRFPGQSEHSWVLDCDRNLATVCKNQQFKQEQQVESISRTQDTPTYQQKYLLQLNTKLYINKKITRLGGTTDFLDLGPWLWQGKGLQVWT